MSQDEHVRVVRQGSEAIARWREEHPTTSLDLSGADLRRVTLVRASLNGDFFRDANLEWADFRWADLVGADFSGARLERVDFHKADLARALFVGATLVDCNLEDANCRGAEFRRAVFGHTRLLNVDLAEAKGLETIHHAGPSSIDRETLMKAGHLPSAFLRGCGLSEAAIRATHAGSVEALAATLGGEGEFYSCFISYSSEDGVFAEQLRNDLLERGVRCWFAPKDMPIGARILDTIFGKIRQQEKLLLILSEPAVRSAWVRDEVERAFAEERDRRDTVVFPIRLDDAVMESQEAWAEKIRDTRHIGDFRDWQVEVVYRSALEKLLRDLRRPEAT